MRQEIRDGAEGIKIWTGSPESNCILIMPVDLAKAIVAAAHKAGNPVFADPSNQEGIEVALESGVDILAHTTDSGGPWPSTLVERMNMPHDLIPILISDKPGLTPITSASRSGCLGATIVCPAKAFWPD